MSLVEAKSRLLKLGLVVMNQSALTLTRVPSFFPDFVVMTMTPLAARAP